MTDQQGQTRLAHLRETLGLERQSDFVRAFFFRTNMRASIYMSLVMCFVELWMIVRLTTIVVRIWPRSPAWLFAHYAHFVGLLAISVVMLVRSIRFMQGRRTNHTADFATKWVYSLACLAFGIYVSVGNYAEGEQILAFITMELFVGCLLVWSPLVSFAILTSSFLVFFVLCHAAAGSDATFSINLFTLWLSIFMLSISNYNRTRTEALEDERLSLANRSLRHQADHDDLTDALNMRAFRERANAQLAGRADDLENLAFLYFDIENFGAFSEKMGYEQGNAMLVRLARHLEEAFPGDLVGRVSDDHFLVLTSWEGCQGRAQRMAENFLKAQGGDVYLELKCGICRPTPEMGDSSIAGNRARMACSFVKRHFGELVHVYDDRLERAYERRQFVINQIDQAAGDGRIRVFYQPVVSTRTGTVAHLEALARWQDPAWGMLPPFEVVTTLEDYRQIHKLDMCIVDLVCRDIRDLIDAGERPVPVSLNFSRLDFELFDVPDYLEYVRASYDIPRELLVVEVTESALADDSGELMRTLDRLREMGYELWLDDFGSGYSSFNVLKDYHFDTVKIDMVFLRGFDRSSEARVILRAILDLCHDLGMRTLTEGVETREALRFLAGSGCTYAQGYLFGKPMPLDEALAVMRTSFA